MADLKFYKPEIADIVKKSTAALEFSSNPLPREHAKAIETIVFESIMRYHKALMKHLEENNLILKSGQ